MYLRNESSVRQQVLAEFRVVYKRLLRGRSRHTAARRGGRGRPGGGVRARAILGARRTAKVVLQVAGRKGKRGGGVVLVVGLAWR